MKKKRGIKSKGLTLKNYFFLLFVEIGILAIVLFLFFNSFIFTGNAVNTIETGYKLEPGKTAEINAHGISASVKNTGDKIYFIPTKTQNGWNAFLNNLPAGANVISGNTTNPTALGNCVELIKNGKSRKKIDVVFVADGYVNDEEMKTFVSVLPKHIGIAEGSRGILSREPFLSNQKRFNFYYINKTNTLNCLSDAKEDVTECYLSTKSLVLENCPFHDEIIVLVNTTEHLGRAYTSYHILVSPANFVQAFGAISSEIITSHEFGHSFGGLKDEYISPFNISDLTFPNCDSYGCQKWCSGTPDLTEPPWEDCSLIFGESECISNADCSWFSLNNKCALNPYRRGDFSEGLTCSEGTSCIHNCHGTDGFRSSQNSVMGLLTEPLEFNAVSKTHIENIFMCCYPQTLDEYDAEICEQWNEENNGRYSNCIQ